MKVYFIRNETGSVQIGTSINPENRLKSLQVATPEKLVLLTSFPANPGTEKAIQKKFETNRINGDWFRLSDELFAYIKNKQWIADFGVYSERVARQTRQYAEFDLTLRQKEILKGTILGGSSLVKPQNGVQKYLSMRSKDTRWLLYKVHQLGSDFNPSRKSFHEEATSRWHSICHPMFNAFYNLFYNSEGHREIKQESLNSLHDLALAIWYGDAGLYKNKKIVLNTHIWKEEGTQIIQEYFSSLDYKCRIFTERKKFRIELDEVASDDFVKLINPHLPYWFFDPLATPIVHCDGRGTADIETANTSVLANIN